jgi:Fe2+ or Zn2+ uptake regulation protein
VTPELIRALDRAVEDSTGVRVEERSLLFGGVCASCRKAGAVVRRAGQAGLTEL